MNRFVPIEKQSRKAQRAYYTKQRNNWGQVKPATRIIQNKKKRSAKARQMQAEDEL